MFEIICVRFEPLCKGALRGALDLCIRIAGDAWLLIHNFTLHENGGKRWIQGPVQSRNGKFMQLLCWRGEAAKAAFQKAALEAVDQVVNRRQGAATE